MRMIKSIILKNLKSDNEHRNNVEVFLDESIFDLGAVISTNFFQWLSHNASI